MVTTFEALRAQLQALKGNMERQKDRVRRLRKGSEETFRRLW
jgi:hypothetical protein